MKSAIVDGEVIILDEAARTDFAKLRSAITWKSDSLVFVAFDLLHVNGADLRFRPLIERRAVLED